jgi:hypothetical protein
VFHKTTAGPTGAWAGRSRASQTSGWATTSSTRPHREALAETKEVAGVTRDYATRTWRDRLYVLTSS